MSLRDRVVSSCRTLYGGAKSFDWACGHGWDEPISSLSYSLEELNLRLRKWHVAVKAEQVKEKFGGLRFYYSVSRLASPWRRAFARALRALFGRWVISWPPPPSDPGRAEYVYSRLAEGDGRACAYCDQYGNRYSFYARHAPDRRLSSVAGRWLSLAFSKASDPGPETAEQAVMTEYAALRAEELVDKAEAECGARCEECGREFKHCGGKCVTEGWIRALCEDCVPAGAKYRDKDGKPATKAGPEEDES